MIKAIFFTRFHPEKGSRVLHQVPNGAIVPSHDQESIDTQPLFDFPSVSGLVIPDQEYCDRPITVCINHYRIISYPVCVEHPRYLRNQYIFNFALVLSDDADFTGYMNIVRKLASMFRNLEEQSGFLSKEEDGEQFTSLRRDSDSDDGMRDSKHLNEESNPNGHESLNGLDAGSGGKVYALCEMIFEDLNNYYECMIPIDESNTINLKLFPKRPPPAPVYSWHVPLSTVRLPTLSMTSSDLTLTRILRFINGISSVAQIAQQADTDLNLTRKAISHLLYYGCIILLDIFQFSAIYAPTAEIGAFIEDADAQEEVVRYVCVGQYRRLTERELDGSNQETWAWKSQETGIDRARLVQLYASLRQGLTLKNWCLEHDTLLAGIDVRRFITFGIIKGFLYRVHKYAVIDGPSVGSAEGIRRSTEDFTFDPDRVNYWRDSRRGSLEGSSTGRDLPLARFLDGMHCFDEICTELQLGEKKVLDKMKSSYSDVQFINR